MKASKAVLVTLLVLINCKGGQTQQAYKVHQVQNLEIDFFLFIILYRQLTISFSLNYERKKKS